MNINDVLYTDILCLILLLSIDTRSIITIRRSVAALRSVCVFWHASLTETAVERYYCINLRRPIMYHDIILKENEKHWHGNIIELLDNVEGLLIIDKKHRRIFMQLGLVVIYHCEHMIVTDKDAIITIDASLNVIRYKITEEQDTVYRSFEANIGFLYIPISHDRIMRLSEKGVIEELRSLSITSFFIACYVGIAMSNKIDEQLTFIDYETFERRKIPTSWLHIYRSNSTNIAYLDDHATVVLYDPVKGQIIKEKSVSIACPVNDLRDCMWIDRKFCDMVTGEPISDVEYSGSYDNHVNGYYENGQIHIVYCR